MVANRAFTLKLVLMGSDELHEPSVRLEPNQDDLGWVD